MKAFNNVYMFSFFISIFLGTNYKPAAAHTMPDSWMITTFAPSYTTHEASTEPTERSTRKTEEEKKNKSIYDFVQTNWNVLTADMAKGEGIYLTELANLLKIAEYKKAAFYAMTKAKFKELVPSPQTTPEQLVNNLNIEIGKL